MARKHGEPVLVTTKYRGVFYGFVDVDESPAKISLTRVRCAIRFATTGGVLELAAIGPNDGSLIGSEAENATLYDITGTFRVSNDAAAKAWS